jgi:hypothetical protein
MAFGLPSAEEIRDYLISQGKDPAEAARIANVTAQQNAAQAARTSALSVLAGAAPARAASAAAIEAAPAAGRAAMSVAERVAAAPRNIWEYLTVPQGVVRNPTTGARIPTRNVTTGRMERTPDYFLPGQQLAQGTAGATALGAGAAGAGALMDKPTAAPFAATAVPDRLLPEYGDVYEHVGIQGEPGYTTPNAAKVFAESNMAAKPLGALAVQVARERAAPVQQRAPIDLTSGQPDRPQPGGLARLFSDPYAGKSARDLYAEANRMQGSGDEYGANLLMQRAGKMITKPEDLESTGMAAGGAAKPHKDAALHKALDIIAHMLGRH